MRKERSHAEGMPLGWAMPAALAALAVCVGASCWPLSEPLPSAPCEAGQKRCGESCVPADDPAYGCAAESCDPCVIDHGTAGCSDGQCAIGACEADRGDCNDSGTDGCETLLTDNARHCGLCNYDCRGADCTDGLCGQIQIAANQYRAWAVVANESYVYWTNDLPLGGVWRTPRDAADPSQAEIFAHVDGPMPRGLAIDATHLYWTAGYWDDDEAHEVRRAALDDDPGTTGELLNDGNGGPRQAAGIAIDADRVYWTDGGNANADPVELPGIWSVDKAGTETPIQVAAITMTDHPTPNLLAVDDENLYWTSLDVSAVFVAPKDGVEVEVSWPHCNVLGIGPGWGIALDDEQVYWREGNQLHAATKEPGSCPSKTSLLSGYEIPRFMVRDGQCLFWMYNTWQQLWENSQIVVTRTDGTGERLLATATNGAHGIAVDDEWIYWTDWDDEGNGGVYKVARPPLDCQ